MRPEVGGFFEFPDLGGRAEGSMFDWLTGCHPSCTMVLDGRQALLAAGRAASRVSRTVWLPGYLHTSILQPFAQLGLDVHYYGFEHPLVPQLDRGIRDSIVLIVDYFGAEMVSNDEVTELLDRGNAVITDITHSVLATTRPQLVSDRLFHIASLVKTMPIPDGGLLLSAHRAEERGGLGFPRHYGEMLEAMVRKRLYLDGGCQAEEDRRAYTELAKGHEQRKDREEIRLQRMPGISTIILQSVDRTRTLDRRAENLKLLASGLPDQGAVLFPLEEMRGAFFLPLVFPSAKARNEARAELVANRVFPPVHWENDIMAHELEIDLSRRLLSIPIDQRYGQDDMERVLGVLRKVL